MTTPEGAPAPTLPGRRWPARALLIGGVVLAAGMGVRQARVNAEHDQRRFTTIVERALAQLDERLHVYEYGLRGTRGYVLGRGIDNLTVEGFGGYAASRAFATEFPGALGYGFIRRVAASEERRFVASSRAAGHDGFQIRTLVPHDADRYVIQFIEPRAGNLAALGLDIGSDHVRRQAADASMQTGLPTLTAPVPLVQLPAPERMGFLLLLAIDDASTAGRAWNPSAVRGWAYAPLSVGRMLHGFGVEREGAHMVLTDVSDPGMPVRIYPQEEGAIGGAEAVEAREFRVFGRTWRAEFTPTAAFANAQAAPSPWTAAGATLALSAGLAGLVLAQQRRTHQQWTRALEDARLRAVVESLDDAIVGTDRDGRIVHWSRSAQALLGYEDGEVIGRPVASLLNAEAPAAGGTAAAPASPELPEEQWLSRDGRCVPVWVTRSPIRDVQGHTAGWWLVLRDMTPARQAEARLRESERRFRDLAESLPHMVWTCRVDDGACDYLSPQWVEYTGIPAADQLGYGWQEQLHPEDVERTRTEWASASGAGRVDIEFRVRRHDGVYRWFKTRAILTRDPSGAALKWYGSNTDIQALKDAQATAEQVARDLERRVAERTAELASANDSLAATKKQLERAQRIAHVGSWEGDLETGAIRWSAELSRLLGRDPDAPPPTWGEHVALFEGESWASFAQGVTRAVETREPFAATLAMRGTQHALTVAVRGEALHGQGRPGTVVATFQDITVQEQQAAVVRELSDRLRLATSAARAGVWEWEIASGRLVWDELMHAIYETDAASFPGTVDAWRQFLHPDDAAATMALLRGTLEGREEFRTAFRIVLPGGAVRRIRTEALLHGDATGVPERIIGVDRDVTEEWAALEALQASEARLQMALENAAHGLWDWHVPSGRVEVDARWAAIMGHDPERLSGDVAELWAASLHPDSRAGVLQELQKALDSDAYVYRVDYQAVRADGRKVWVNTCGRVYQRDAAGAPERMMGTIQDITAHKKAEALLLDSIAEKEVLLREVHHRVKNNLAVVSSLLYLQSTTTSHPDVVALLEDGRTRVQSMALVHEQLYRSTNLSNIRLDVYVEQLARMLLRGMRTSVDVALRFDLDPVTVEIDHAVPCGLIVNELLTNALKHAFEGRTTGLIDVRVKGDGGFRLVEVADDGVGIALPKAGTPESLGLLLVRTLSLQLGASAVTDSGASGTRTSIRFEAGASR